MRDRKERTSFLNLLKKLLTNKMDDDDGNNKNDYFGTWISSDGSWWGQVTINASKLVWVDSSGYGFTLEELTWTPITNPHEPVNITYPKGYKISGKVTDDDDGYYGLYKADGTVASVGDIAVQWWYMSNDEGSLAAYSLADGSGLIGPFFKH